MPKGVIHKYSDEQITFISANRELLIGDLTEQFNQKFSTTLSNSALHATRKRYGFKTGRTGRFERGSVSWNTGKKGIQVGGRSVGTQFKKGHVSANLKPLGSERICPKDGIILIKVAEPNPYTNAKTRYKAKHLVVWEVEHGPVPTGYVVRFKDNNKLNCSPNNLELVTKRVNLQMNRTGYTDLPLEIKPAAKLVCELEVKIHQKSAEKREVSTWQK